MGVGPFPGKMWKRQAIGLISVALRGRRDCKEKWQRVKYVISYKADESLVVTCMK